MKAKRILHKLYEYLMIAVAGLLNALSLHIFVNPNKMVPGGFSGLSSILYYIIPELDMSVIYILLNIPLLVCSLVFIRGDFTYKTIFSTVICSVSIALFEKAAGEIQFTDSPLIAVIFGGILIGISMYIAAIHGGSNGGTEVIAKIVAKYKPEVDLSTVILFANLSILVVGSAILVFVQGEKIWIAAYSLIYVFTGSSVMAMLIRGFDHPQKYFIVSYNYQQLGDAIIKKYKRGVTYLDVWSADGQTLAEDRKVIMVVVQYRQAAALKRLIAKCDDRAFTFVRDVHDVFSRPSFNRSYDYDKK
ncbi:MAG: YitT family protein [Corallococcus sp.]|nr:YitT family protein [Corallococcus sp.]